MRKTIKSTLISRDAYISLVPLSAQVTLILIFLLQAILMTSGRDVSWRFTSAERATSESKVIVSNDSSKAQLNLYTSDIDGPKDVSIPTENLEEFRIKLRINENSQAQFMNLFQTSDEGSGIRLEQIIGDQDTASFNLIYRSFDNSERLLRTKNYLRSSIETIEIYKSFDNDLEIKINDKPDLKTRISKQDIRFDNFVLGAGLSSSRPFFGKLELLDLSLTVAKRRFPIPVGSILIFPILLICFRFRKHIHQISRTWLSNRNKSVDIASLTSLTVIIFLTLNILNRKKATEFFGDDFLIIFPVRGSTPWTIFQEGVGTLYRPLGEIAFLFRFLVHGYDIHAWSVFTNLLVSIFCCITYFNFRSLLTLSIFSSTLLTLTITTSPLMFSQSIFWPSVGTEGILKLIVFSLQVRALILILNGPNVQNYWRELFSLSVINVLISDTTLGMVFLPLIIIFIFQYLGKLPYFNSNLLLRGGGFPIKH